MIRSGEGRGGGRPGRGRKGKDREGGVRRRPGVCASARRLPGLPAAPRPAPAPAPTAARGARAASAPPPPEPRASASCARSPARAGGGGDGALRPRGDPGSPPPGSAAGALTFISGERAGRGRATAGPRVSTVLRRARVPPSPENAHGGRGGGGEEAASAFQTSQEFRTLRPNPGCPCG